MNKVRNCLVIEEGFLFLWLLALRFLFCASVMVENISLIKGGVLCQTRLASLVSTNEKFSGSTKHNASYNRCAVHPLQQYV